MVYALYSEGVRQGGINRSRGEPFFPLAYDSDLMKNYELGYKSSFADGRGRLNLTYYHMAWEDYQLQTLDPSNVELYRPRNGRGGPLLRTKDTSCMRSAMADGHRQPG